MGFSDHVKISILALIIIRILGPGICLCYSKTCRLGFALRTSPIVLHYKMLISRQQSNQARLAG